eukprot:3408543-Pleurochrysis_carterae.AAC.4
MDGILTAVEQPASDAAGRRERDGVIFRGRNCKGAESSPCSSRPPRANCSCAALQLDSSSRYRSSCNA